MKKRQLLIPWVLLTIAICMVVAKAEDVPAIEQYDVTWDSPSENSLGSMPLGNGDIGANVWVEPSGDIVLLLSKTDTYDEFNRLLKLGRIRIKTTPALVRSGQKFQQKLCLEDGTIQIIGGDMTARIWIDANHPVVEVDVQNKTPIQAEVFVEIWRTKSRELNRRAGREPESFSAPFSRPGKAHVNPDVVLPHTATQLAWCHHNTESQWKANLELTALGDEISKYKDPILNRTFGAVVRAEGFKAVSDTVLKTATPLKSFSVQIVPVTQFADSPEQWLKAVEGVADAVPEDMPGRFAAHRQWWRRYWQQSWVIVTGDCSLKMPVSEHSWHIGMAPNRSSRFQGTIAQPLIFGRALSGREIAALAAKPRRKSDNTAVADVDYSTGLTVAAWIKPAAGEKGRIFDNVTPGKRDGIAFGTYPGLSLRWTVGPKWMVLENCLEADEWQHVAATVDADTGMRRIYLNGKLVKEAQDDPDRDAGVVSEAYALQQFVMACAGRGALPIKFNGSLFTVDQIFDPDYRRWGGAYWWQNTRLIYWPMLYCGDYEMMLPLFKMYRRALPLREAATKKYYGHDGAFYPETMYFWGNFTDINYGLDRKGKPDGLIDNAYIRRYWQGGLELLVLMLDYYDATQDIEFRDETLLPMAKAITTFSDQHWKRGKDGKIFYSPAQSLETWHTATNPLPEIAGLRYLLPRLMQLPVDNATRIMWKKLLADQPNIPMVTKEGKTYLLPAVTYSDLRNKENPELYAVFPYSLYTDMQGGKKLQIGINTWNGRRARGNMGWQQQPIQAAMLGLTDQARELVVERARGKATGYRFPGFYGPNYDWTPDQDHISVLMTALQRMVMQCDGDRIMLLPAWPKQWNASFKLHAPKNTVIEGKVISGEVVDLKVTPESRRKDVEICKPFRVRP